MFPKTIKPTQTNKTIKKPTKQKNINIKQNKKVIIEKKSPVKRETKKLITKVEIKKTSPKKKTEIKKVEKQELPHPFLTYYYDKLKESLLPPNTKELQQLNKLITSDQTQKKNIIIKFVQAQPLDSTTAANPILLYLTRVLPFPAYYEDLNSMFFTSIHKALRSKKLITLKLNENTIDFDNIDFIKQIKNEIILQSYLEQETYNAINNLK